jgi:hypothetical protein
LKELGLVVAREIPLEQAVKEFFGNLFIVLDMFLSRVLMGRAEMMRMSG